MNEAQLNIEEFLLLPATDGAWHGTIWKIEAILPKPRTYRLMRIGFVRKNDEPPNYDPSRPYRIERPWGFTERTSAENPLNEMLLLAVLTDSIDRGATHL